jgi:hypothetical protein
VIVGLLLGSVFFGLKPTKEDAESFFGMAFQQVGAGSCATSQLACTKRAWALVEQGCCVAHAWLLADIGAVKAVVDEATDDGHVVDLNKRPMYRPTPAQVLFVAFGAAPQLDLVLSQKALWVKHRDAKFVPPYAQVGGLSSQLAARAAAAGAMG